MSKSVIRKAEEQFIDASMAAWLEDGVAERADLKARLRDHPDTTQETPDRPYRLAVRSEEERMSGSLSYGPGQTVYSGPPEECAMILDEMHRRYLYDAEFHELCRRMIDGMSCLRLSVEDLHAAVDFAAGRASRANPGEIQADQSWRHGALTSAGMTPSYWAQALQAGRTIDVSWSQVWPSSIAWYESTEEILSKLAALGG